MQDPNGAVEIKRKKECFELFMGGFLHDWWNARNTFEDKWVEFFRRAYDQPTMILRKLRKHRPAGFNQHSAPVAISINVSAWLEGNFQEEMKTMAMMKLSEFSESTSPRRA
jgi:hypothetical protein